MTGQNIENMTAPKLPEKYIRADLIYDKCIMYLQMDLYKTPHLTQGHRHKTAGVTVNMLIIIWKFLSFLPFIKENYFVSLSTSLLTKNLNHSLSRFAGLCWIKICTTYWQEPALPRRGEKVILILGNYFYTSLVRKQ